MIKVGVYASMFGKDDSKQLSARTASSIGWKGATDENHSS